MAVDKQNGKTAKEYAQEQLGSLDLSYLDNERNVANNTYNTTRTSLENNFNNLVDQINSNRQDTRKNFNMGRSTIAENAYNANRVNQADLASRGVGSSGLKSLGEVGNRMETGKQYSNLANKFYNDMTELDVTEKQGRTQYETDLQNAKNTLDNVLAGIGSREGEVKNNYNMSLGQLAEQIQGRWDSNYNSEKQLEMQKKQLAQAKAAAAQAHADAVNAAKNQLAQVQKKTLAEIVGKVDKNDTKSIDNARAKIQTIFSVDSATATKVLQQLGLEPTKTFSFSANKTYTPTTMNDIYKYLGIN